MFQVQPPSVTEVAQGLNWFQRNTGWGWTVAVVAIVVLGAALVVFWWKWYRPLLSQVRLSSGVFTGRARLAKARGTLDEELKGVDRAWVIWPCGTAIPGLSTQSIRKIERAIFTDIRKPIDFAPYSEMLTLGSYAFRQALYQSTWDIRNAGNAVKWHRHPSVSVVIGNPNSDDGWARFELLMPYMQAADRPSVIVSRRDDQILFQRIIDAFEATWNRSSDPYFDDVTIPGGPVYSTSSGGH